VGRKLPKEEADVSRSWRFESLLRSTFLHINRFLTLSRITGTNLPTLAGETFGSVSGKAKANGLLERV
jgi:hypothetical protein